MSDAAIDEQRTARARELHEEARALTELLRALPPGERPRDVTEAIAFYAGAARAFDRAAEHVVTLAKIAGLRARGTQR